MEIPQNNQQSTENGDSTTVDDFFLPDFCNVRMVFAVILIAELLAIVLTLAPLDTANNRWEELGIISLFIQWVALISAGVLCIVRPWLRRLNDKTTALKLEELYRANYYHDHGQRNHVLDLALDDSGSKREYRLVQ